MERKKHMNAKSDGTFGRIMAASAVVDITPKNTQFLYGYPHVERYSTGVNDPLLSSALYISNGRTEAIFIANDIIHVSKKITRRIRKRIMSQTGIQAANIMVTATHTHSGPKTVHHISEEADTIIPEIDADYIQFMEDGIVNAAITAYKNAQPARIGLAITDGTGVGTNRCSSDGPADMQVPVLLVQNEKGTESLACMLICSMHPTVLHEDSTLVSGDFPAYTRRYLQKYLGNNCAILYHTGPSGNQSPRYVTTANTFAEAQRLGEILGNAVEKVLPEIQFKSSVPIECRSAFIKLAKRTFPEVAAAQEKLDKATAFLEHLRRSGASSQDIRTAECDWFGAEETLTLAKAAVDGRLARAYKTTMPTEIQTIKIGPWVFVGWQGEIFVEYALELKKRSKNTFVISNANGELQGYIVTRDAESKGGYEASNAIYSFQSGDIIVKNTIKLLEK